MDYKWIIMISFMFYRLAYINGDTLGVSLSNHQSEVKITVTMSVPQKNERMFVCLLVGQDCTQIIFHGIKSFQLLVEETLHYLECIKPFK